MLEVSVVGTLTAVRSTATELFSMIRNPRVSELLVHERCIATYIVTLGPNPFKRLALKAGIAAAKTQESTEHGALFDLPPGPSLHEEQGLELITESQAHAHTICRRAQIYSRMCFIGLQHFEHHIGHEWIQGQSLQQSADI